MGVSKEQLEQALDSLEGALDLNKASEQDLDQPEGADLGNGAKEKMSDAAKAKKAKKSEGKEDEDGDEDDMEIEKKKGHVKPTHIDVEMKSKKSFAAEMPEEVQTKIEVSGFLKSLVDHTAETVDALRETVVKSEMAMDNRYSELSEAVEDIAKSQAKIGVVLKAICEQIGIVAKSPAREPKAETVAKSSGAAERKFTSALGEGADEGKLFKSVSENPMIAKSQIANAMCDLVRKGEATDLDVIGFESGGYIRPELVTKLKTTLN